MSCGETCSTHGCHGGIGCAAHRTHYDTLANRMQAKETYAESLIEALLISFVIALPFVIFFWNMT